MTSVPRLDKKWDEIELKLAPETAQAPLPSGWRYYGNYGITDKNGDYSPGQSTLLKVESEHFVACSQL